MWPARRSGCDGTERALFQHRLDRRREEAHPVRRARAAPGGSASIRPVQSIWPLTLASIPPDHRRGRPTRSADHRARDHRQTSARQVHTDIRQPRDTPAAISGVTRRAAPGRARARTVLPPGPRSRARARAPGKGTGGPLVPLDDVVAERLPSVGDRHDPSSRRTDDPARQTAATASRATSARPPAPDDDRPMPFTTKNTGIKRQTIALPARDQAPADRLRERAQSHDRRLHRYPGRNRIFTATSAVNAVTTAR